MVHATQAAGCQLRPVAVLQPPPTAAAAQGLPSMALPSDHIPLVARFQLAPAAAADSRVTAAPADSRVTAAPAPGVCCREAMLGPGLRDGTAGIAGDDAAAQLHSGVQRQHDMHTFVGVGTVL